MKMRRLWTILALAASLPCLAESSVPTYKKLVLTTTFYCEGAYVADFNRDTKPDVVSGPFWYAGPTFSEKHEVRPVKAYDPHHYSDNFLTYTGDFNGDGWPDIFYVPFPGKEGYWYENPQGAAGHWKQHLAVRVVDNESPMWHDVNKDGRPDLVFNTGGQLGYATYDPTKPNQLWTFVPVTPKGGYGKFTHGIGCGDINGDGLEDLLEKDGWWEQPAGAKPGEPWKKHPLRFAEAASQMHAYDVDGDGHNDVICSWHCHHYGLEWYRQVRNAAGDITWEKHEILPAKPDLDSPDLRISQLHAVDVADVNGDGLTDIVTGKRFWSHGPKGDVEPDAPAVVYWFELRRDGKGVHFVPHMIDDDSGVGTQVTAADLNADGIADIVVGNKKGTFVSLSQPGK